MVFGTLGHLQLLPTVCGCVQAPKLPAPSEYGRANRTGMQQRASHFRLVATLKDLIATAVVLQSLLL